MMVGLFKSKSAVLHGVVDHGRMDVVACYGR